METDGCDFFKADGGMTGDLKFDTLGLKHCCERLSAERLAPLWPSVSHLYRWLAP